MWVEANANWKLLQQANYNGMLTLKSSAEEFQLYLLQEGMI